MSDPCWTLGLISEQTGGLHIDHRNDLSVGVGLIRRAAGTYYSLGATPAAPARNADGYEVELVSKRPGVTIHLRRHVVPRDAADPAREMAEAAVLFGASASDLPVELRLGDAKKRSSLLRRRDVVFVVRIPIASLEFEEKKGVREAGVELTFITVDGKGDCSEPAVFAAPLRVPDEDWELARQAVWPYEGTFVSRPGAERFTVTVRDVRSNRIGTAVAAARLD